MKVLVTGADGQLGRSLRKIAASKPALSWIFTDVAELDITDLSAVRRMVAQEQVDVLVNCAAFTNVDAAEDQPELAERLNAQAVENLAIAMKETGGLLVHISTDYVFGAGPLNTPIREDQTPAPSGVYGLTKLHGEEAIQRVGCRHIIIRTAWLYSEYGKNFVKTMLRLTAEKPSLKVVFDQVGTPTYAGDLARVILAFLEAGNTPVSEIYHFTNEGACSWYDFAQAIARYAGHSACDILPCHSDEFPSKVHRPAYSVLDKSKIKARLGMQIPYWTDSLQRCLSALMES